jgi:hypothetical protein
MRKKVVVLVVACGAFLTFVAPAFRFTIINP